MARKDPSDLGMAGPGLVLGPQPTVWRRLSAGHVVMIVAGLLAALITYSILRQAGGAGTRVEAAASEIQPGQAFDPSLLTVVNVKAPASVIANLVTPGQLQALKGHVAVAAIPKGTLVSPQQFQPAKPPPASMAIAVDPQAIPGGASSLRAGSKIDLVGVSSLGIPLVVQGLTVIRTPDSAASGSLGAAATVRIDVAVPDLSVAQQVREATSGGKFALRVAGSG